MTIITKKKVKMVNVHLKRCKIKWDKTGRKCSKDGKKKEKEKEKKKKEKKKKEKKKMVRMQYKM